MRKGQDLTGRKFGMLTVIGRHGKAPDGRVLWSVECSCGATRSVRTHSLTQGQTVSCGCYGKIKGFIHGASTKSGRWPEYSVWSSMLRRCGSPKSGDYDDYGGRGISVCSEWANSFEAFINHVGRRPSRDSKIDRIDVDGNYEPGNVRWIDSSQSAMNKRAYKNNKTGLKGVGLRKGKYRARLQVDGEILLSKTFGTKLEAAQAYNEAARRYHGEFAHLNDLSQIGS